MTIKKESKMTYTKQAEQRKNRKAMNNTHSLTHSLGNTIREEK